MHVSFARESRNVEEDRCRSTVANASVVRGRQTLNCQIPIDSIHSQKNSFAAATLECLDRGTVYDSWHYDIRIDIILSIAYRSGSSSLVVRQLDPVLEADIARVIGECTNNSSYGAVTVSKKRIGRKPKTSTKVSTPRVWVDTMARSLRGRTTPGGTSTPRTWCAPSCFQ